MSLLDRVLELHRKHRWLSHIIYWAAVLSVDISSSKYRDGKQASYVFELVTDFIYEIPEILATYAMAYLVLPKLFYRRKYVAAVLGLLLVSYLACVLGRIFIVKVDEPLAGLQPKAFETYLEILTDLPKLLYVYFFQIFATVSVFLFLKTLKDQLLVQKRNLSLEKEKAETELRLLKAQLNPHFLFNTLNNIYSLSFTSPARTSESIARLADILDHILYRTDRQFVPLSTEIALLHSYIELEKLRYDDRLTVNIAADVDRDADIAPLILLSLVENAFKHGASNDPGEPVIDIEIEAREGRFRFEISNTVAPPPHDSAFEYRRVRESGIGLTNLRRQLQHLYGPDHKLLVADRDGRFRVRLCIDLEPKRIRHEEATVPVGG